MARHFESTLLKSGLGTVLFSLIIGNMILFFIFGVFFDGGAFPYGEIRVEEYWIANNDGARPVSRTWFWVTFWQGFVAWFSVGLFILCEILTQLISSVRRKVTKDVAVFSLWSIGGVVWVSWVVLAAMSIADPIV